MKVGTGTGGGGVERGGDGEWGELWMVYYLYPKIGGSQGKRLSPEA